MNVLCLTRYDAAGASSRYRFYQYLPYIRAAGLRVDVAPLFDRRYLQDLYGARGRGALKVTQAAARRLWDLRRVRSYDLLWMEKELFPFLPDLFEHLLSLAGTRFVADYDDAIFHQYDQHPSRVVRTILGRKIDRVMAAAAVVVAGNNYLAARARSAGARVVHVLPTVVDLERYPPDMLTRRPSLTLGWIGSPSTQAYLRDIAPALAAFCRERGARMMVIGARPDFSIPGVSLEVVPWTEEGEVRAIQELDIGLMPLPDSPWERGKCGLKLIQYMGCGLPVVASPVGVNSEIVVEGETGFLAESNEEWLTALRALGSSAELRKRLGMAGRARAEARYSLRVVAPRLVELLIGAAKGQRPAVALASA